MAEPIKVGDLVMIVKPTPCGCTASLGRIYRVQSIGLSRDPLECSICQAVLPQDTLAFGSKGRGSQPWRLKRIPPLDELEGEKRDEEITA